MPAILRVFIGILLLGGLLAACIGDDDTAEEPATNTSTEATATQEGSDIELTASPDTPTNESDPTSIESTEEPTEADSIATPALSPTQAEPSATATTTATEPSPTATEESSKEQFVFGWNVALRGDDLAADHNTRAAQAVNDSGFGWVRFMIPWDQFERADEQWDPLPFDRMIQTLHEQGLNILVVVAKAPEWAQSDQEGQYLDDPAQFQEFMRFISDRYRDEVQAWEIWNEQNLAHEFGGSVNVEQYVDMLRAGSQGVRQGNPEALVLFGGLTPSGVSDPSVAVDDVEFLRSAYEYNDGEIAGYFDILGVHLNSTHNPPDADYPLDNPEHEGWNDHPSFFFRRAEDLHDVMVEAGAEDTPVWITEFGWTTENQAEGYEYGANNTEEEVARYLTGSLDIATEGWDWVTGAFVWNLNWSTLVDTTDEKHPWSALTSDWSARPAFDAMRDYPKE